MPSPDLPGYVDLTIFDRSPYDLVERVKANLLVTLPGYQWRAGSVPAAVTEALALLVAENGYQINRLPGAIFETLLGQLGIEYDQGSPPTATVTVTVSDDLGYVIPAGTRFLVALAGDTNVVFALDADLAIDAGDTSNAVPAAVTGTTNTDAANGTAVGTLLVPVEGVAAIDAVELASEPAGGAGPEAVADWFDRGAARLSRFTDVLHTAEQFEAAAVELEPAVVRVVAYERYDPAVDSGPGPGASPGNVTVAVGTAAGAALTAPQKVDLEAALEELAAVDVDVHLIDPTVTAVEVDVTVERLAGYTDVEVEANVLAALEAYLDPATWGAGLDDWSGTVYRFELISVIDAAEGVSRVVTLTTPAADLAIAGDAPLADFDDVASSVTVQAP